MFFMRLLAVVSLSASLAGSVLAEGSKIEFDGTARENPSSPAAGEIRAIGTYEVEAGLTYQHVEVLYRKTGEANWTVEKEKVKVGKKDGKSTWELTLTNVPSGDYEVQARLIMKNAQGETLGREMEKARNVTVKSRRT
jgi:hypothetical protein